MIKSSLWSYTYQHIQIHCMNLNVVRVFRRNALEEFDLHWALIYVRSGKGCHPLHTWLEILPLKSWEHKKRCKLNGSQLKPIYTPLFNKSRHMHTGIATHNIKVHWKENPHSYLQFNTVSNVKASEEQPSCVRYISLKIRYLFKKKFLMVKI